MEFTGKEFDLIKLRLCVSFANWYRHYKFSVLQPVVSA